MIKTIIAASYALLVLSFAVHGQADSRLAATWKVQKYSLDVTLPRSEGSREIGSKATLEISNVSTRPAATLTLRLSPDATVSTASVNGQAAEFTKSEEKFGSISLQRVALRIPSIAPGAKATVVVDYKLAVKENSPLHSIAPTGSQLLPMSFWYPTPNSWFFARGADFAPVQIAVNSGAGFETASSGTADANGSFSQQLLVQPFFITGNWVRDEISGVTVLMPKGAGEQERKRAAELAQIANDAKAYYSGLFGRTPATPVRLVSAGRGAGFHSGGTVMIDAAVFRRPKVDSGTAMNISEAIAKLFVGDSLEVSGDGYGIIREGLPRFLANEFIENKFGKDVADIERTRQRIAYSSSAGSGRPLISAAPLDDHYFTAVANKGAMVWRLLARRIGQKAFFDTIAANAKTGSLSLAELRNAFADQKALLDDLLDGEGDGNLLAGLPQVTAAGHNRIALRNTGASAVTVNVGVWLDNGETMSAAATLRATSFGEVTFKTPRKIVRVEIDPEKLYPQSDYSDDIAPRETTDSDLLLAVKRDFDRQAYAAAEKTARTILRTAPRYDDVRVLLGRSLLALGRVSEAEKEFTAVLNQELPSARSWAWASVGMADVASRTSRASEALKYAEDAIRADADYGVSYAARNIRRKLDQTPPSDRSITEFFSQFDRAAISNRKAELDSLILPGEIPRFSGGISGQATEWKTTVTHIDQIDTDNVAVEAQMSVRLLTREPESGIAVYRLTRVATGWKLSAVEIFEVR